MNLHSVPPVVYTIRQDVADGTPEAAYGYYMNSEAQRGWSQLVTPDEDLTIVVVIQLAQGRSHDQLVYLRLVTLLGGGVLWPVSGRALRSRCAALSQVEKVRLNNLADSED